MEKTKNLTRKAGKYLRELSVVVIGVAITLLASNWLSSRNEKKDTALYVNALKLELALDFSIPQTSAFEMFKTSGSLRFIDNKETLQAVWNAYSYMEQLKIVLDMYFKDKKAEALKEYQLEIDGKPVDIPMYNFYNMAMTSDVLTACQNVLQTVKETLSKLNEITP